MPKSELVAEAKANITVEPVIPVAETAAHTLEIEAGKTFPVNEEATCEFQGAFQMAVEVTRTKTTLAVTADPMEIGRETEETGIEIITGTAVAIGTTAIVVIIPTTAGAGDITRDLAGE
jgi:hypothetical protein